jgi:hypothetical protein
VPAAQRNMLAQAKQRQCVSEGLTRSHPPSWHSRGQQVQPRSSLQQLRPTMWGATALLAAT